MIPAHQVFPGQTLIDVVLKDFRKSHAADAWDGGGIPPVSGGKKWKLDEIAVG